MIRNGIVSQQVQHTSALTVLLNGKYSVPSLEHAFFFTPLPAILQVRVFVQFYEGIRVVWEGVSTTCCCFVIIGSNSHTSNHGTA